MKKGLKGPMGFSASADSGKTLEEIGSTSENCFSVVVAVSAVVVTFVGVFTNCVVGIVFVSVPDVVGSDSADVV